MDQSSHVGLPIEVVLDLAVDEAGDLVALHASGRLRGGVQPSFLASPARNGMPVLGSVDESYVYASPEWLRSDAASWDQRSDLYAFGIALFQLLTGRLPFVAEGAAEWRHAHLAVAPPNPARLRPGVPPVLDAIVLRLLAKDPLERYLQAETLRIDLTSCRDEWRRAGEIPWFDPAAGDAPHRATNQGALFGRSKESARLRQVLGRVSDARHGEVLLISGGGGVGKTSLVQRVLREMAGSVTVASAKSDKLQRDNPYAPIAQVMRGLMNDVVAQGAGVLDAVRSRLASSLDGHERLIVDLVPESLHVFGSVSPIADVPAQLERVRTQGAILRTLAAFLDPSKPLVLFIDDLQWFDGSSRDVLDAFVATAPESLCLICAFRDADDGKPFAPRSLIEAARAAAMPVTDLTLSPLDDGATAALVNSAFPGGIDGVGRLVALVKRRTAGNPFAIHQALRTLFDEGSIVRDPGTRRWSWHEDETDRAFRSEDDDDVMATRLERLSDEDRELLARMACIGRRVPFDLLHGLMGGALDEAKPIARSLVEGGFLVEEQEALAYAFGHDRTFEAAYSLFDEERRRGEHAGIARALLAKNLQPTVGDSFEIANQIELAGVGPLPGGDRVAFAGALVAAATTARRSGGVDRALRYLDRAATFADGEWWCLHPALACQIHILRAELFLATASLPAASVEIDLLLEHAPSDVERATARRLQAVMLTLRSDYDGAITAALMGLDALGIRLERGQPRMELDRAYATVKEVLGQRTIAGLSELPVMTDTRIAGAMAILSTLISSIFTPDGLRFLHMAKMVELTLIHGTTQESAYGLSWFGVMIASLYEDYEDGQAWAEVATALVERHGYDAQRTATLVALDQVSAWTRPMSYSLSRIHEAIRVGHAAGDVGMTCYARNHLVSDLLIVGERLDEIEATVTPAIAITQDLQYRDIELLLQAQRRLVRSLTGHGGVVVHDGDEIVATSTRFWVRLYDGIGVFWDGRPSDALPLLREAADLIPLMAAHIDTAWCSFFLALAIAGAGEGRDTSVEEILTIRERFARWAELNPGTFRNKLLLIDAEKARVSGDALQAMALYDQAADAAESSGFGHERALAHELAGRHLAGLGLAQGARRHFDLARGCYARWAAHGKADRLTTHHGLPLDASAPPAPRSIDLALALRVSQSMSEEIVLDTLVRSLVTDLIVHAGASHGALVMFRDDQAVVEATGAVSGGAVDVQRSGAVDVGRVVPPTVFNVVTKTRKALMVADGRNEHEGPHAADRAVRATRSVLCVPLLKRSMLVGLVYLENRLTGNVFTTDRTTMIELLASQAAISLENADLYGKLVEENRRRETSEAALWAARAELGRTAQLTVLGGLAASVAHEVNQPLSAIATHADATVRWLSREVPDLDEALQGVRSMRAGVDRATEIIRGLRALARQTSPVMAEFQIGLTVRHVVTLLEAEVGVRNIELALDLEAEGAVVRGDAIQFEQVILNLVNNAVDVLAATVRRGRRIRVKTAFEHAGVRIGVTDNGPGIQPEILASIFDPLFTTKADGMGMGLAICRSIVEAHGGKLEVSSDAAGTTFSFVLAVVPSPSP